MAGLFALGGEAHITAKDRYYAFCGLGNTVEEVLRRKLPALDTPEVRHLADDLANAILDDYFEEHDPDDRPSTAGLHMSAL